MLKEIFKSVQTAFNDKRIKALYITIGITILILSIITLFWLYPITIFIGCGLFGFIGIYLIVLDELIK